MYVSNPNVPQDVADRLQALADDETLEFADVAEYLDAVPLKSLASLEKLVEGMVEADGVVSPKEQKVQQRFTRYLERRRAQEA